MQALQEPVFLKVEKGGKMFQMLKFLAGKKMVQMLVKPETALVRPFVVCAILRGCVLNPSRYNSFIDLQVSNSPTKRV